jgi:hypothetical protein
VLPAPAVGEWQPQRDSTGDRFFIRKWFGEPAGIGPNRGAFSSAPRGRQSRSLQAKAAHNAKSGPACHAEGRGFESHQPLGKPCKSRPLSYRMSLSVVRRRSCVRGRNGCSRNALQLGYFRRFARPPPWLRPPFSVVVDDWLPQLAGAAVLDAVRRRPRVARRAHRSHRSVRAETRRHRDGAARRPRSAPRARRGPRLHRPDHRAPLRCRAAPASSCRAARRRPDSSRGRSPPRPER